MKPEDFRADAKRPLTGEEYLKSLQDGREIYIYGERLRTSLPTRHFAMRRVHRPECPMPCTSQTCRIPSAGARTPAARLHP
ncbi:hypothetical protein ACVXG7_18940 [Enterobacter hormaechei]